MTFYHFFYHSISKHKMIPFGIFYPAGLLKLIFVNQTISTVDFLVPKKIMKPKKKLMERK